MGTEVRYNIVAKDKTKAGTASAKRNFGGLQGSVQKLGGSLGAGALAFGGFAAAGMLATQGLRNLNETIKESISLAGEQEQIYKKLGTSVELAGANWEKSEGQLKGFFAQLQKTTQYGDTDSAAAFTTLVQLTSDYDKAMQGLPMALDLAAGGLFDLTTATRYVGLAMNGEISVLGRYISEFKNLDGTLGKGHTAAMRADYAVKILNEKFGGSAAKNVETYAGRVDQLNNSWGDAKEALGDLFLPVLTDTAVVLRDMADATTLLFELFDGAKATDMLDFFLSLEKAITSIEDKMPGKVPGWIKGIAEAGDFIGSLFRAHDMLDDEDTAPLDNYIQANLDSFDAGIAKYQERVERIAALRLHRKELEEAFAEPEVTTEAPGETPGGSEAALEIIAAIIDNPALMEPLPAVESFRDFVDMADDLGEATSEIMLLADAVDALGAMGSQGMSTFVDATVAALRGSKKAYGEFGKVMLKWSADTLKAMAATAAGKALYYLAEAAAWASVGNFASAGVAMQAAGLYGTMALYTGVAAVGAGLASAANAPTGDFMSQDERESTTGLAGSSSGGVTGGGSMSIDQARLAATSFNVTHVYNNVVNFGSQDIATVAGIQAVIDTGELFLSEEVA